MARPKLPTSATFSRWLTQHEESMFIGHLEGALRAPELTRHLGPKERARSWALRATACRRKRKLEDTVDAWSIAFSLSSDDPWILSRHAVWQLDQGHFAQGLATAIHGLELACPDDQPVARSIRGQALWLCGHSKEALSDFVTAAHQAPLNSPTQLCSLVSIAIALANSPSISPQTATHVLELASDLRGALGTRKLPRLRALLRWATGLAQCARGRDMAGARDLYRARQASLDLGDIATAAAITLDYATVTGRPQEPLLSEILAQAPVDTESDVITRLAAMASGRSDRSQRSRLASLAVVSNVRRRWQL